MTVELAMAGVLIALGIVQLMLTAIEYRRVHGVTYANTARDVPSGRADSKLLGRLSRAQNNLMETAPYFIGTILVIQAAGLSTKLTQASAVRFVLLRIIYLPLYAFGVPNIRGLIWTLSLVALSVLAFRVLEAINWQDILVAISVY